MDDYRETTYSETFDNVYADLKRRCAADPRFTKEELKGILQGLYVSHGCDWEGRGEIRDIMNEATIAACELVLAEWKNKD